MIVLVNYRAIKFDNHQGGSGMPYTDKMFLNCNETMSILNIMKKAKEELAVKGENAYTGAIEIVDLCFVPKDKHVSIL